ncbi:MAG: hypothetical protein ACR2Q4_22790 [Geminicoccaceae bacterium]
MGDLDGFDLLRSQEADVDLVFHPLSRRFPAGAGAKAGALSDSHQQLFIGANDGQLGAKKAALIAPTIGELRDNANAITILVVQGGRSKLLMRELAASLNRKVERGLRLLIGFIDFRRRPGLVQLRIIKGLRCNLWSNSKEEQGYDAASERPLSKVHDQLPVAQP